MISRLNARCLPMLDVYQCSMFTKARCLPMLDVYQCSMFTNARCLPMLDVYQYTYEDKHEWHDMKLEWGFSMSPPVLPCELYYITICTLCCCFDYWQLPQSVSVLLHMEIINNVTLINTKSCWNTHINNVTLINIKVLLKHSHR